MTKSITKALIFTTLDTLRLKKLMIMKISTVWILCICVLIMQVDILKKEYGNKYLVFDDSVNENKEVLKKYTEVWGEIKYEIKIINGGKKWIRKRLHEN